ncbi:MAG: TRASH domain-containing protein [Verrucomicrobiota bacterium]
MKRLESFIIAGILVCLAITSLHSAEKTKLKPEQINKKIGEYPLTICVITTNKLGSKDDPFVYRYQGREIHFCCKSCDDTFEKNPTKGLAMLDAAVIAQQKESYPFKECLISQEPLVKGELVKTIDNNNNLFLTCCKICAEDLRKDPETYQTMLQEAYKNNS